MPEAIDITVQNKLVTEKRDLNVYHHSKRSAYIISHCNTVSIPLGAVETGDYLHLSVVSGPGRLEKECLINMPSWCDFSVSSIGNGDLTHSGDRTVLRIPPGPPAWQLKITRPSGHTNTQVGDYVTIGDDEQSECKTGK